MTTRGWNMCFQCLWIRVFQLKYLYGFTSLHILIWIEQLEKSAIFLHVLVEVEVVLLLLM